MIPFILAAVGGYLIGDSMKDNQTFAKGGMVVTSIKDIPNFKQRLDEGKITYRGLGLGKLFDRFYDLAGETGTRIKVDGKEYFITNTEFDTFNRDSNGRLRIRFDAPARKGYADGGNIDSFEDYIQFEGKKIDYELFWNWDLGMNGEWEWNKLEFNGEDLYDSNIFSESQIKQIEKNIIKKINKETNRNYYADGGETDGDDMGIQFIDYKGKTIMFEPHFKEYFTNDIEFKSLAEAKKYIDAGSPDPSWQKFAYSQGLMADGGSVNDDGYVVYFGVFRGRGLTPVITEYYENLADAEKSVEEKKAKKEKGWKIKPLNKMPVNSEVRMGKDNPNYDKVENTIHSEERVTEFFKGKDSFYKKDFFWVKPQGYEWDNWQLVKK